MAISQQQKVDFLLKKIGYTKTKTGLAVDSSLSGTKKAGFAEALPSPLIIADTSLWTESGLIPTTPPGSDSSQVKVYLAGSSGLRMTVDSTVAGNRAFLAYTTYNNTSSARLTNWIDTQFGNDYLIKVYKGDPNSGGVALSASGSGANDGWFFDYSAGVLNFNDTSVPSGVTGTNIYIVGYRYIGNTGAPTPGDDFSFQDLTVTRNLSVGGLSTFTGAIDANGDLDVDGHTNLDNVSIAGVSTFTGAITANGLIDLNADLDVDGHTNLDNVSIAGVTTATGNIIANGSIDLAGDIDVDGHTNLDNVSIAGVTTAAGAIDLNADLDVDGHTNLDNVSIAGVTTTAGLLNIDAGGQANTFKVEDLTSGRVVLAGTGGELEDSANLTFNGSNLTVGGNVNAVDGVFTGNVTVGGTLTYEDVTNVDAVGFVTARDGLVVVSGGASITAGGLNVTAGVSTFNGALDINNNVVIDGNVDLNGDIDVDGHTNLDNVSIAGVVTATTFVGNGDFVELDVDGHTNLDNVSIAGVVTATTFVGNGDFVELDVDGHTNLDNVSIAGVTTTSGALDAQDIIKGYKYTAAPYGSTTTITVTVADKTSAHRYNGQGSSKGYVFDGLESPFLTLTPGRTYKFDQSHNSNSTHQIKFYLEGDKTGLYETGVTYNGTAGNAGAYTQIAVGDQTPVVLHYMCVNHGYMGNSAQLNSNVVNTNYDATLGSHLNVAGVSTLTTLRIGNTNDITSILDEDNMASDSAAALATQQSIKAYVDTQVTAQDLDFQGDSGTGSVDLDSQSLDIEGTANEIETVASNQKITIGLPNNVTISNQLTVTGAIDANGDLDVDGHTNLDNVSIAGVTTTAGAVDINADLDVDGHTNLDNVSIAGVTTTAGLLDINAGGQANTFKVEDLTPTRVVYAGPGGELQDSANLVFDGSQLYVSGIAITTVGAGHTSVIGVDITTRNLKAVGITTLQGIVNIESNLDVDGHAEFDNIKVAGIATFSGPITAGSSLGANGQYMKRTATGVIWDSFPTLRDTQTFTATASQDTFNFSYNVGFLDVYHNGVKLTSSEFTASNGTNVVLGVGCFLGDIVELVSYNTVTTGGGGGGGAGSVVGINTLATSYFNHINAVGVITASKIYGDGSNLTGVIASGTGIVVKDSGSAVGTAGTINFGSNLSVTAVSAGIVTVNSSGVIAGINTIGFSTFKDLLISGVSTFNGGANFNGNTVISNLNAGGNSYPTISGSNGQVLTTNGSGSLTWTNKGSGSAGAGGTWSTDTIGINTTKNVGIGTTAKLGYSLYVEGDQRVTGILTVGPASLTLDGINNKVTVGTAVTLFHDTGLFVGQNSNLHSTGLEIKNINASGDLDVDGHTNLDNLSVSGVSTFAGAIDVDGHTELDNVNVAGVITATEFKGPLTGNVTGNASGTAAGLSGTPDITVNDIDNRHIKATGIITAANFIGDGSGLTGVTGVGAGIVIKDSDSTVGTAGTIKFGSGFTVSPASAGIVTVTGVNHDWGATTGITSILNKPTIITYDLVGSNNTSNQAIISLTPSSGTADTIELLGANGTSLTWDASNKRVTFDSVAPLNPDWNATSGISSIQNKPTIPSAYTLPTASGSTLGGIKVGSNLSINGSGVLSANVGGYTLPMAAANTLGGIKIGSGLSIDGNGVVTASGSASTPSIADVNSTTGSIGDDASAELNITGHKAYTLFKVTVSKPSWVRIYCDDASRDADVNRSESNDPTPGSGVIAEVRTTSDNQAVLITPGIQGFNNDNPRNANIYTSVTNRSGSATAITVTLTVLQTGS